MSGVDTRNVQRDSLFLLADIKLAGDETGYRAKVRNLSSTGMMAADGPKVARGAQVSVKLRNLGWVEGVVAWVQEDRFGIAFASAIDASAVRAPTETAAYESPRFTKPSSILPPGMIADQSRMRKV